MKRQISLAGTKIKRAQEVLNWLARKSPDPHVRGTAQFHAEELMQALAMLGVSKTSERFVKRNPTPLIRAEETPCTDAA